MKIDLNADMQQVYARLAEKEDAGVAEEAMHLLRNEDHSGSTPDTSPKIDER
jgi:hypothetical protein